MPYVHLPAPEYAGTIDPAAFEALIELPLPRADSESQETFNQTFSIAYQPVTDYLNQDTVATLEGGSVLRARNISRGETFSLNWFAKNFHTDVLATPFIQEVVTADQQGVEFISGMLYIPEVPTKLVELRGLLRIMLDAKNLRETLDDPRHSLSVHQARPYTSMLTTHATYHRAPVNLSNNDSNVDRNLLIARYEFANADLDTTAHKVEKARLLKDTSFPH